MNAALAEPLDTRVEDGVLVLTLNRPEARNALSPQLIDDLDVALDLLVSDKHLRAAVITGSGTAFCAGIDRTHFASVDADRSRARALLRRFGELPKPLIGAINGPAVAGGLEVALGCDFLVGSRHASFADAHLSIGAFPSGGLTARLPRVVGPAAAKAIVLSGLRLDADDALRLGLLVQVVEAGALVTSAARLAASAAAKDPELVCAVRDLLEKAADHGLSTALREEEEALVRWRATGRTGWKV